jgi:hypothetical protein
MTSKDIPWPPQVSKSWPMCNWAGVRKTWAPHAVDAWYIGPTMDHYRQYQVWAIATRQTRIVNSLHWFPQKIAMPIATNADIIRATGGSQDTPSCPSQGTSTPIGNLPDTLRDELTELTQQFD